jgi:hypothetical protein
LSVPLFSNSSELFGFIGVDLRISDLNTFVASTSVAFSPQSVQLVTEASYLVVQLYAVSLAINLFYLFCVLIWFKGKYIDLVERFLACR